jgi:dolichol-phosphate mannosyltransferase
MDADLSHPPKSIPALVEAIRSPFCDVAIGSRYAKGGSVDANWGLLHRLNSSVATRLARGLTNANDPLAGFFAIRRETVERNNSLCPLGYKILLELIVRCDCPRVIEIPIEFRNRVVGKSKLSVFQQWQFIRQLAQLYAFQYLGKSSAPGDSPTMKVAKRKSA